MCIVKAPTVTAAKERDPAIIRNPYLDGLDPASKALRTGRSALRIERRAPGDPSSGPGGTVVRPTNPPALSLNPLAIVRPSVPSGGGGGSGNGGSVRPY